MNTVLTCAPYALGALAAAIPLTPLAIWGSRRLRDWRHTRRHQAWATQPHAAPPAAEVHTGADEAYGDDLRTMTALLRITSEQPVVEDTDTDRAIARTRSHVDDVLVELAGDNEQLLAEYRETAERTGAFNLGDLWADLDAEDALLAAEARAAHETNLLRRAIGAVR
jgi:hypothetical protein